MNAEEVKKKVTSRGHWEINFHPQGFEPKQIPSTSPTLNFLTLSGVPHVDSSHQSSQSPR